jgi:hypothetical protein
LPVGTMSITIRSARKHNQSSSDLILNTSIDEVKSRICIYVKTSVVYYSYLSIGSP